MIQKINKMVRKAGCTNAYKISEKCIKLKTEAKTLNISYYLTLLIMVVKESLNRNS